MNTRKMFALVGAGKLLYRINKIYRIKKGTNQ